jgi:hypothetical protein
MLMEQELFYVMSLEEYADFMIVEAFYKCIVTLYGFSWHGFSRLYQDKAHLLDIEGKVLYRDEIFFFDSDQLLWDYIILFESLL